MSEPLTSKVPLTRLVTAVTSDITQTVTSSILWMNGRIIAERAPCYLPIALCSVRHGGLRIGGRGSTQTPIFWPDPKFFRHNLIEGILKKYKQ